MDERFIRTSSLIGDAALDRLFESHIAVFGVGGVGSFAVEALARAGVGELTLIDDDVVNVSNINRQLIALSSTIGRRKVDVMRERVMDINPSARVNALFLNYSGLTQDDVSFDGFDYAIDAIDTVTSKLLIIERAREAGVSVISCMGTGNKLDPARLKIAPIEKTSGCPLARVMRRELKKRSIEGVIALYSDETPLKPERIGESDAGTHIRRSVPGSVSFVPSVAGLMLAGKVIRDIIDAQT